MAVLVTGGIIGGPFWYDGPSREDSVSGGVRAGLPEGRNSGSAPSSQNPSRTASPAQSSATSTSLPSSSATGSQATPTGANGPRGGAPSATATGPGAPGPSESGGQAPVLRLGDKGPEVVELQLRLRQIGFYDGDADGEYDREVENAVRGYQLTRVILQDESGVYGVATRASLESETKEP
ncbi:peptidoglycan-binding domain-containing protein [Streptomyces sp. NPDC047043]|uniref:peptidoglycan-binding domain-containing protein n=1 Tax=Streptomyces sp. NPDC047043 TaxID=3154497 RepID=UPI00340568A6